MIVLLIVFLWENLQKPSSIIPDISISPFLVTGITIPNNRQTTRIALFDFLTFAKAARL
jgi:hypothetical protein